jgi:hypothetical protein
LASRLKGRKICTLSRVQRRIFELKEEEATGDWRKLRNEELHNVYSSSSTRCSLYNLTLIATVFASFGDISIRRLFFKFLFVRKNLQNSFAADAENVLHLLEDKHPRF